MANQRCLRWSFSLLIVFAVALQPAAAKERDLSEYTLRVHIFQSQWSAGGTFFGEGSGIANLYDGPNVRGITFSYECPVHYQQSVGSEAYAAKWKKAEKTIELIGSKVGSPGKSDTCTFKITLHDFVYDVENGTIATFTPEQYRIRIGAALPKGGALDTNPAHYPLRLAVLQTSWEPPMNGTRKGAGRGNLMIGPKLSSVDFTSSCSLPFSPTPDDRYYAAIWVREGSELAIMLNTQSGSTLCTMDINVHTDIYVRENGAVKAVSQDEYTKTHPK